MKTIRQNLKNNKKIIIVDRTKQIEDFLKKKFGYDVKVILSLDWSYRVCVYNVPKKDVIPLETGIYESEKEIKDMDSMLSAFACTPAETKKYYPEHYKPSKKVTKPSTHSKRKAKKENE